MTKQQIVPIAAANPYPQRPGTISTDVPKAGEGGQPRRTSFIGSKILPPQAPDNSGAPLSHPGQVVAPKEVAETVANLNDYMQDIRRSLQFSMDEESGRTIITVIDAETKEVIRQIPSDEVLALVRRLKELNEDETQGLILNQQI